MTAATALALGALMIATSILLVQGNVAPHAVHPNHGTVNGGHAPSPSHNSAPPRADDVFSHNKATCEPQPYNFGSNSYCGANHFTGASYPVPTAASGTSWSLASLQLVTRHGDRTPVNILPFYDVAYPFCGTTASLGFYQQESNARGVRHAASRPRKDDGQPEGRRLERIPYLAEASVTNPYAGELWQGNCMTGQLTSKGVAQLEGLGSALHDIYVTELGFLPATYSRANTSFYLRTTDVWRTRQSAESLLTGLWPASTLADADVIPLHSYPEEVETMFANSAACPAVAKIQSAQIVSDAWTNHLDAPEVWSALDDVLGVGDLPSWHLGYDHYFDNFQTRQCHGLPLPCAADNATNCITQDIADFVYTQGDWEYQYTNNESPLATQLAQVGISGFMAVIRDVLVAFVSGDPSASGIGAPDFAYYSGHDTTIGAVLGALNVTGFQWPPYASNMQFELWKQSSSSSENAVQDDSDFYVRVLYNGAVLPMYAAGCCDDMCPADDFISYLDSMIPDDVAAICAAAVKDVNHKKPTAQARAPHANKDQKQPKKRIVLH